MFGIDKLTKLVTDVQSLLIKVLAGQLNVQSRIVSLEAHLARERSEDRAFILSVVQLLHTTKPAPVPMRPALVDDPFKELDVGDPNGYSNEELGIYDSPQAEE